MEGPLKSSYGGRATLPKHFVLNFNIYKLKIQIQISLMIGNIYLDGQITDDIKERKIETFYIYEQASGGKKSVYKKDVPG